MNNQPNPDPVLVGIEDIRDLLRELVDVTTLLALTTLVENRTREFRKIFWCGRRAHPFTDRAATRYRVSQQSAR